MQRIALMILMGFIATFSGCSRKPEPASALPEITSETEEGFVDLVFAITQSEVNSDGTASFLAQGLHRGETVGLKVLLRPPWKEGALGEGITTFQGRVNYESTGEESDRLVQILGELYQSPVRPRSMRKDVILFTGITLEGDPRALTSRPVKIKLFVESEDENRYMELYTNIDVQGRRLEIREKDPDYRDAVMLTVGLE
jgi:hypothetical protein